MIHETSQGLSRTERRRLARREEILDAALEIVVARGIDALTAQAVAARMDASVGALYRYFQGMPGVVLGLQLRAIQALQDHIGQALPQDGPPLERVRAMAWAYWTFGDADPALAGLLDAMMAAPMPILDDAGFDQVERVLEPLLGRMAGVLQQAQDAGALGPGDAALRTHTLWAALHGAGHLRKRASRGAGPAPDAVAADVIDTLLRGWRSMPA